MPSLAEDLMLLLLDDESGRPVVDKVTLDHLMAGAVLLELANNHRVTEAEPGEDVKAGRLVVRDSSPTDDPVLDAAIDRLDDKPVKGKRAVELLVKGTREAVLNALTARGLIRQEDQKVLGFIPRKSWPAVDSEHEDSIRTRLNAVLLQDEAPDLQIGSLVALLYAGDAVHKAVDGNKRQLKARAKDVAEGNAEWTSEAVRKAIQNVRNAVTTAVVVSAAASAGAAGGQ